MSRLFRFSSIFLAATLPLCAQTPPSADVIYRHGSILTGAHLRADDASATPARVAAIAVSRGKILAVGSDETIERYRGPATRVIDLQGAFAMPGFNDAHVHMAAAGQEKLSIDLIGTRSLAELQRRVKEYAAHARPGAWLVGGGWDQTLWTAQHLPSRKDLDAVTAGHPAVLSRVDGHLALANSAALAAGGIGDATKDPAGAKIDRDADGRATGILREAPATKLVFAKVPTPSTEQRRQALELAIADALAHGVTSVQDNSTWEDFLVLEELEHGGRLKLRVAEWLDFDLPLPVLRSRRASHPTDDPLLHLTQLKGFLDGSLGSRTAALETPYADDPANSGLPRYDDETLNAMTAERAAAGFQIGFHAIGDLANTMALDAFAGAEQNGQPADRPSPPNDPDGSVVVTAAQAIAPADLRLRVEHAQVVMPEDFARFATLGVIASMQPAHLLTDMTWAAARLGPDRLKGAYAWRSFLDHGVTLAFGTDYPVEAITPFRGLYAAVTRKNVSGTASFEVQETISIEEALYAYTQASAFAEFRETVKGRLEPGYFADVVVLDRDVTKASPRQLLETKVLRTIVNGETVYLAEANGGGAVAASPAPEKNVEGAPEDAERSAAPPQRDTVTATDKTAGPATSRPAEASPTVPDAAAADATDARSGTSHPPE